MAEHDFILKAADDLLANTPALVAYAKANILAGHGDGQRDLGAPVYLGGKPEDQTGTTIRNRLADEAFEGMVLAALSLAASRQQHLSAIRTMDLMVGSLKANVAISSELIESDGEGLKPGIQSDVDGRPVAYVIAPEPNRLTDAHGNRFFKVGDLVTRDGTDIHRVVDHNGSDGYPPDGFTVVCVKAPADGWCEVGDEEFNVCRRYEWLDTVQPEKPAPGQDSDLPQVGSFHG